MRRFRFDLKLAFLAMSNLCVVAWATRAMLSNGNPIVIPAVAVFASLSCIWYGIPKSETPVGLGAIGGCAGMAIFTVSYFASHGIGYFFYTGTADYFDDGAAVELVLFPPIALGIWGGLGAIVGTVCGALVWAAQKSWAIIKR
jgi:hypothetical protein